KDRILIDENENIYLKTTPTNLKSWDRNGNLRWESTIYSVGDFTQPVLRGDHLYFGEFFGLYKLDCATGKELTPIVELPSSPSYSSSPLIDDSGTIYVTTGGIVSAVRDDSLIWTKSLGLGTSFESYAALSISKNLYLATWSSTSTNIKHLFKLSDHH
ncbi:MAG: hypothetical protein KDC99_18880, partial [Cyclobacteriaceae bacterium]|nr:hypothetical protein [Cyclobacteriaceae bacterium]